MKHNDKEVFLYDDSGNIVRKLNYFVRDFETGFPLISSMDFEGEVFKSAIVPQISFELNNFDETEWESLSMRNSRFTDDSFRFARFLNAKIAQSEFYGISAFEATFIGTMFTNVIFRGGNLDGIKFKRCSFNKIVFSKNDNERPCSIEGVDFSDSDLTNVIFSGARYNDTTLFPSNFCAKNIPGLFRV